MTCFSGKSFYYGLFRFIEHGEYKENQYGTSIEAIRSVQAKNKMCIVDVQPEVRVTLQPFLFLIFKCSSEDISMAYLSDLGDTFKSSSIPGLEETADSRVQTICYICKTSRS